MNTQDQVQQIMAQIAAKQLAQSPIPQTAAATPEQVASIIESALKKMMPQLVEAIAVMDSFFSKALSTEDFAAFKEFRAKGSPGFKELIESDKLHPIAQLLWDEMKSAATL